MLLDEKVEVSLHPRLIGYYEALGYVIPRRKDKQGRMKVAKGTTIFVKVADLPPQSSVLVNIICDYCGRKVPRPYHKYNKSKKDSPINKDSCGECKNIKGSETSMLRYGVDNVAKSDLSRLKLSHIRRKPIHDVKTAFRDMGYIFASREYIRYDSPVEFICIKHFKKGKQITTYDIVSQGHHACKHCHSESMSGENSPVWKGGSTPLNHYFREKIHQWKMDSLKEFNFKCVITGSVNDLVVHHLYNFSEILKETLCELSIDVRDSIGKYSCVELNKIEELLIKKHYDYGLGIPLRDDIHKLFHKKYGNRNNTRKQFEEFKDKYISDTISS